jgi:hypothetical protein
MTSLLSNSRALDLSRIISGPWATQMPADFGVDVRLQGAQRPTFTRASASWPRCTYVTRPPARVSAWACPELTTNPRDATAIVARQEQGVLA